jgi:hypothetical protein
VREGGLAGPVVAEPGERELLRQSGPDEPPLKERRAGRGGDRVHPKGQRRAGGAGGVALADLAAFRRHDLGVQELRILLRLRAGQHRHVVPSAPVDGVVGPEQNVEAVLVAIVRHVGTGVADQPLDQSALIFQHPVGWQELRLQQRLEEGLVQRRHRVPFLSWAVSLLRPPIRCKPTARPPPGWPK